MGEDCLEGTGLSRLPGQQLGPPEPVPGLPLPAQLGGTASGTQVEDGCRPLCSEASPALASARIMLT